MQSCSRTAGAIAFALVAALHAVAAATADDLADFYRGKTITLVVGYPANSGYSIYGQALARHFGGHVPGKPNVVVQNKPGASSVNAANWLATVAPRDGTALGIFSIGAAIDGLLGLSANSYDPTVFAWIGNMDQSVGSCVVSDKSGINTFDDLLQKETLFGGTAASGGATQFAIALKTIYGAKIKLIRGYPGAEDAILAMERGEVQGVCGITIAVLKTRLAEGVRSGRLRPIIHDNMNKVADLAGVPGVYDYAKTDDDRRVLDLLFGWRVLGRPVAAPPETPADRVRALRTAFMAAMSDPNFVAEAKRMDLDIAPSPGADVEQLVKRFFAQPKETRERAANAVRGD